MRIKIAAAIFILAIVVYGVFLIIQSRQQPQSISPSPQQNTILTPGGEQIPTNVIQVDEDSVRVDDTVVSNFYQDLELSNAVGDVLFKSTTDFQLIYIKEGNKFLISILGSPFDLARQAAERDFLETLSIDENEACSLEVDITTPLFANEQESANIYDLSFCE